jgi:hypothetical protein
MSNNKLNNNKLKLCLKLFYLYYVTIMHNRMANIKSMG